MIILAGLSVGSFLNVCIYRLPLEKSVISPPSACPNCGTRLKPIDLIPVLSYIFLQGKCRYCNVKFSFIYPLIEFINAFIWVLLFLKFQLSPEFFATSFLASILLAMFVIDLQHKIIPDELVVAGIIGGAITGIYNFFNPMSIYYSNDWWQPLFGAFSSSIILLIVFIIGIIIIKTGSFCIEGK